MPRLSEQVADKKAQGSVLRRTPEIDAKLDQFIGENNKLHDYYAGLSKEELIRKLMLKKMQKQEYRAGNDAELRSWVEEHPEIKQRIEERIRNVPAASRERAFLNVAKAEAQKQTVRGKGARP